MRASLPGDNGVMPASIESRRHAIADALRRDAAAAQVSALARRVRLVEAVVFETTWDSATATVGDERAPDVTPVVPAVPLDAPAMSARAADVLFGGRRN